LLPSDLNGWALLGAAFEQQRRWQEAEAPYRRAVALDPGDARALLNLANLMATVGRLGEALHGYRQAVRAEPGFCLGWIALGRIAENGGHREEAEGYYRKALACNTDASQAATIATFCESRGWLETAATNYALGLKLDPTNARLRRSAGKNLLTLEKYQSAVEQFREAVRLQPQSPELRLQLGKALGLWGHNREALDEFGEVLHNDPANVAALDGVNRLRAKLAAQSASEEH
jgi:tetratricopeptide (TPR) repeat protein